MMSFCFFFFARENLQKFKKKKAEKVGRLEPPQPPRVRRPWTEVTLEFLYQLYMHEILVV